MSKLIRHTQKRGTALFVALQLTALTFLSLVSFVGGPQQSANKAPAGTEVSAPAQPQAAPADQTQTDAADQSQTAQPLTAADKSALRASAHFAKKLQEPLATQVFELATSRAESAQHSAQQASQEGEEPTEGPTLTTDREDYPPFSYVYFHGSGFQPGETVDMLVVETDPIQQSFDPWHVVADENGEFDTSWYIFSSDFQGATFLATATGESSQLTASATFTDAFGDGTMSVSPGSTTPGSTGNSFTFSFRTVAGVSFGASSYVTIVVPAGWANPTGNLSVTAVGAATVGSTTVTGTGPWTITQVFTASAGTANGFNLSYSGVTASSTVGVHTFTTGSHSGSGGSATAILSSPGIVVSPTILQRGAATIASVATGTSLILNKPSGVVQGDLMIANFAINDITSGAPSLSGWIPITTITSPGDSGSVRAALLYKVAGASEPANYTFTWTTSNAAQGAIVAFSGVDTVSGPFDVTPGTYTIGDGKTGTNKDPGGVTAITNATANAAIVMFASSPASIATGLFTTATSPGALSELYGDVADSNANGGAGWGIKTSAGSTTGAGSATRNPSANKNAWAAILLALKPITCTSPSVTTNPSSVTKTYGDASATFTAAANGTPAPTVQWQVSTNGGGSFSNLSNGGNISGATSGPLVISNPTVAMSGNQYRAVFTNSCTPATATSTAATLTVNKANATVVVTPYTCPGTTYDGSPHTATITSITGVNGETGATVGTVDVSNTTHTAAGTYSSDTWSFTGTANYNNIAATTITDCIAKANAMVVVTPYTCLSTTYTGSPHTATVTSITGVNGETGATVGTVDVSNTTHTNAGTYASDYWTFTGTGNYNDIGAHQTITDCIAKANATVVVTPYTCPSTTYTGLPHTATYTINGVNGESGNTVGTVNVVDTMHTHVGIYNGDPWSFTGGGQLQRPERHGR